MSESKSKSNCYPGHCLPMRWMPYSEGPSKYEIQYEAQYPIGADQKSPGKVHSEVLQLREVFMMLFMNRLTDKAGWEKKVFDRDITAKWQEEAADMDQEPWYAEITSGKDFQNMREPSVPMIDADIFHYCLEELKGKARYFEETGLIPTLDAAGNAVVKSDTLVPSHLKSSLRAAFDRLQADQASDVDWHPRTNNQVQDLVHPSMYPFVYGRSQFIEQEVVGISNAVHEWSGKLGDVLEVKPDDRNILLPSYLWSEKYQWLPANLAFQSDGSVKFTSYVNNLHPDKYPDIYRAIEDLLAVTIPAWDQVLRKHDPSDNIPPTGVQKTRFQRPGYVHDGIPQLWEEFDEEVFEENSHLYRLDTPEQDEVTDDVYIWLQGGGAHDESEEQVSWTDLPAEERARKVDAAFDATFEKFTKRRVWESMREPIFPMPDEVAPSDINYSTSKSLSDYFQDRGLQVIVKMATIELTPEKPEFRQGSWHIEGQMNEHICATALYYLDSENVTPSHLSFRKTTPSDSMADFEYGQDSYNYLEQIYGTGLREDGCLQNYGSIETREDRLLAFPNTFQHRVSSFELQDPTKPGHRRFIALWLVDPHVRIISTANVPPQQRSWWEETTFDGAGEHPPGRVVPPGLMTVEEAKEHRLALMEERSRFHQDSEERFVTNKYNFCEH